MIKAIVLCCGEQIKTYNSLAILVTAVMIKRKVVKSVLASDLYVLLVFLGIFNVFLTCCFCFVLHCR